MARAASGEIPAQITFAAPLGAVAFRHEMHFKDLGLPCLECHHQIDAKKLETPHPGYLQSSRVSCRTCHDESGKAKASIYTCSECHHTHPANIADETLSAKVVIHSKCWKCHERGSGAEAAAACEKCHGGKKTS